jgi:hypothetical protein
MEAATSATVTGAGNSRREPSGNWMAIIRRGSGNEKARWETALQERKGKGMTRGSDYETSVKVGVRGVITTGAFLALAGFGEGADSKSGQPPFRSRADQ